MKRKRTRKPITPASSIRSAIRALWLRSRERSAAMKAAGYRCECCGVKQSTAKGREVRLHCHHRDGVDWDGLIDLIRRRMLPPPDRLQVLCAECHEAEHGKK